MLVAELDHTSGKSLGSELMLLQPRGDVLELVPMGLRLLRHGPEPQLDLCEPLLGLLHLATACR